MKLSLMPIAALVVSTLVGCARKGAGGAARVPVTVAHAEQRAVPFEIPATGTAEPVQTASAQAQVSGLLTYVTFHDGDDVAAGQAPFEIDPRPFPAAPQQARASPACARATRRAA